MWGQGGAACSLHHTLNQRHVGAGGGGMQPPSHTESKAHGLDTQRTWLEADHALVFSPHIRQPMVLQGYEVALMTGRVKLCEH